MGLIFGSLEKPLAAEEAWNAALDLGPYDDWVMRISWKTQVGDAVVIEVSLLLPDMTEFAHVYLKDHAAYDEFLEYLYK